MRYAIYFAPKSDTALARLGAHWLGRDAYTGETLPWPTIHGIDETSFAAAVAAPTRYGFHATLKPPFYLVEGTTEGELLSAIETFAAETSPVFLRRIVVKRIGSFLALSVASPESKLDRFAARVVESFDRFRTPPSREELGRRSRNNLTEAQNALLARWGYPYVMNEFRFHMTLTGACSDDALDCIELHAEAFFKDILDDFCLLDTITLFEEPRPGAAFLIRKQWPLGGSDLATGATENGSQRRGSD